MSNYSILNGSRRVGVEIEVESTSNTTSDVNSHLYRLGNESQWALDLDEGSLRGGRYGWELKTIGNGIPIGRLYTALQQLIPIMSNSSGTWRAAVHVHVDMTNVDKVAPVFAMSYIMDDPLFQNFSPSRRESNFCVPLNHSVTEAQQQMAMFLEDRNNLHDNYGKYRSVNVRALRTFGTFEYRHMRTPATDDTLSSVALCLERIHDFATACCNTVEYSSQFISVADLLNQVTLNNLSAYMPTPNQEALYHMLQEAVCEQVVTSTNADLPALSRVLPSYEPRYRPNYEAIIGERISRHRFREATNILDGLDSDVTVPPTINSRDIDELLEPYMDPFIQVSEEEQ